MRQLLGIQRQSGSESQPRSQPGVNRLRSPNENGRLAQTNRPESQANLGAGNGIRTHDFNLGKVALYH